MKDLKKENAMKFKVSIVYKMTLLALFVLINTTLMHANNIGTGDTPSPSIVEYEQDDSFKATGTVYDEYDELVTGATVVVKGTINGVITDIDGKFELIVPKKGATIVISFLGYKKQELKADAGMRIKLENSSHDLTEVVVTGVTQMDKRMFTGATTKLSAEDVKIDGLAEISRGLEGRVAGVTVQNVSGTFGAAPKIRVRGATSIYGSSKPLWVVDGVIMEDVADVSADDLSSGDAITLVSSAIAGLNADDIESFNILKDGSSTSIYGARAMAGVIVITTKRGKAGRQTINYTGEFTTRLKPTYNDFNIMNSQEQMGIYKELFDKGWLNYGETFRAQNSGVYGNMYHLLNEYNQTGGLYGLPNIPEARANYLRKAEMRNTDWYDELFSNNIMHQHSVSMSSGTEKATYYASLSALVDPGWSKQSNVNRYTANLNSTFNISKTVTMNMLSNASYRKQKAPGTVGQEIDEVFGEVKRQFDINPYAYALQTSRAMDANSLYTRNYAPFNILNELENNYMDIDVMSFRIQSELKWKIIDGLEISGLAALKYETSSQEHSISDFSNQAMAYRAMPDAIIRDKNTYLYKDPDKPYSLPISILPDGGIYQRTDYKMLGHDLRAMLTWNKVYKDAHIINFTGGFEANSYDRQKTWFNGWGMQYTLGEIPFYVYDFFKKGIEDGNDYYSLENRYSRKAAFFAQPSYSYDYRYTLTATLRYDGSNKLGKANSARWLPTWNVGGSWNASEESFMQSFKPILAHASMRASYSLTGESGPDHVSNARAIYESYKPWRPFADVKESGLNIIGLANEDLTYEKKHELNIGVDLGFLDNKISLSADWYTRDNYDLIGPIHTQGFGGQILKYGNVASMSSTGVEFTVNTKNMNLKDFSWNSSFTFSHATNELTDVKAKSSMLDLVRGQGFVQQGYPVRAIFSIPFMGLDEDGIPTFTNQEGEITSTDLDLQEVRPEKLKFLKYEGPADPTMTGSLGNIFKYKNFRLNVFITYSFGNKLRLDPVFKYRYDDLASMPREFKNRWTLPGDEHLTNTPVIMSNRQYQEDEYLRTAYNAYNYSTERIADGGFIRMKEVSLTYDFPQELLMKRLNTLSVKIQATNLFLLYADKKLNGQDPEFFRSGGVSAPVPKQFTFTLRVGI